MSILEILLLGIGLSMDAFAVSICKGLSTKKLQFKHYLITGAWFGGFQALMPTIGYFLGSTFEQYINVPLAVCLIGITTFLCSAAGLRVGNLFGLRYKAKAELAGGIILILIGLKILLEHLGVISF